MATQFHYRCDQGTKWLPQDVATRLAGENPDYAQQDLFEAIERKEFPSWTLSVQTMTVEQAEKFRYVSPSFLLRCKDITDTLPCRTSSISPRFGRTRTCVARSRDCRNFANHSLAVPPPPRRQAHPQREPPELLCRGLSLTYAPETVADTRLRPDRAGRLLPFAPGPWSRAHGRPCPPVSPVFLP